MFLNVQNLTKTYSRGKQATTALRGVSLNIEKGKFLSIMGPSGSGKSSLLQIIGGLDQPTTGSVEIEGKPLHTFTDAELSHFRRRRLGFIFQFFNLLPSLTALENVCLPLLLDGHRFRSASERGKRLLDRFGLGERLNHYPAQLSGGEMQRVAIARAMVIDPLVILADEPTGNLDSASGKTVLSLLREISRENQQTVLMVTHDPNAAAYSEGQIRLLDGKIEAITGV
jgi:putative ABC transport system ATP-binding protein